MGQILQTIDGQLLESGGPFQVTQGGMESIARPSLPFAAWMGGGLVQLIGEGRTISYARLYETQPWVAIAVNKLSRQISRLPLKVYKRDSQGNRERVRDGALVELLGRPRERSGPIQLKQSIVFPMLLHGNALLEKIRDRAGAPPRELWPLDWRFVQGYLPYQGAVDFEGYGSTQTGRPRWVDAADTLHFRWESPDGLLGASPLMQLGVTVAAEDAAQRYIQALHKNGARPSFAVVLPEDARADKDVRDGIRQEIQDVHGGVDKALQAMIFGGGADVKTLAQTAHEAELIDARKLNREEVAAVYDIPQPLIGILDHATYSNVAEMHRMLYTTVLGPWLTLIEETLQAQLIGTEPAFEGNFVEFDLAEVLRGDKLAEITALKLAVQTGLLTLNEARQVLNLAPFTNVDWADKPLIPANNLQTEPNAATDPADEVDGETLSARISELFGADIASQFDELVAIASSSNGHH